MKEACPGNLLPEAKVKVQEVKGLLDNVRRNRQSLYVSKQGTSILKRVFRSNLSGSSLKIVFEGQRMKDDQSYKVRKSCSSEERRGRI